MLTPTMARAQLRTFGGLVAATVLLSACAGESTAPVRADDATTALAPSEVSRSMVGADDGSYTFTVDPSRQATLWIGGSALVIPAKSICRLADSGYGAAFWGANCAAESAPLTITATVKYAKSDHPRIDFEPALRFSPKKVVSLYMYVDAPASKDDWNILYCSTAVRSSCVDESIADPTLGAYVLDRWVYRRIRHFSGYVVTNLVGDAGDLLGW